MGNEKNNGGNGGVPRYTSYPTAPHFHDGVTAQRYGEWLAELSDEASISLYLHIPFCRQMCWYCGCHTKVAAQYGPVSRYLDALTRELELLGEALPAPLSVSHIHFGGGSPTILSDPDFAGLMNAIRDRFDVLATAEIAVEIDPRTLSRAKASALAAAGVNRVSLGVQDFNEHVQMAINRLQPFELVADAVEHLRGAGIEAINFDLMYGLPGQTVDDVLRTIDLAVELAPRRLAVFGYAHVPWMKTHQRLIDEATLPGPGERRAQADAVFARLVECGYVPIGLDHYAQADDALVRAQRTGRLHRNFQGYTEDGAETLLGLGASSIGRLGAGYVQNAVSIAQYTRTVGAGFLATARGIEIGAADRARGAIIERLMCDLEVDLAAVGNGARHELGDLEYERRALQAMADEGLVTFDGDRVRVREAGRPLVRRVCAVFDTYLAAGKARHSQAV